MFTDVHALSLPCHGSTNFMVMDRERRFGSDERIRSSAFSRHGQLILAGSISPEASSIYRPAQYVVVVAREARERLHSRGGGQDRSARRAGEICWHNSSYLGSCWYKSTRFRGSSALVHGNYETSLLSQLNAASRWNYYFGQAVLIKHLFRPNRIDSIQVSTRYIEFYYIYRVIK